MRSTRSAAFLASIGTGRWVRFGTGLLVAGAISAPASATLRRDPVTLTRNSPSVVDFGFSASDIYHVVSTSGQGRDIGPVGPSLHLGHLEFGAVNAADNVRDVSNGESSETLNSAPIVHFSVSATSTGVAGSQVRQQSDLVQQAADRFVSTASKSPVTAFAGTAAIGTGNALSVNQTDYNLIGSVGPATLNTYTHTSVGAINQDDADSLEITEFSLNPGERNVPVYWTMDSASPTLANHGWTARDVLLTPVGTNTPQLFAAGSTLGLGAGDELDGLAVWDTGSTDYALISLAPGSPYLTAHNLSPADILVTDFSGNSKLYLSHEQLGLLSTDNVDALDVSAVPEPGVASLLAVGAMALLRRRRSN